MNPFENQRRMLRDATREQEERRKVQRLGDASIAADLHSRLPNFNDWLEGRTAEETRAFLSINMGAEDARARTVAIHARLNLLSELAELLKPAEEEDDA